MAPLKVQNMSNTHQLFLHDFNFNLLECLERDLCSDDTNVDDRLVVCYELY